MARLKAASPKSSLLDDSNDDTATIAREEERSLKHQEELSKMGAKGQAGLAGLSGYSGDSFSAVNGMLRRGDPNAPLTAKELKDVRSEHGSSLSPEQAKEKAKEIKQGAEFGLTTGEHAKSKERMTVHRGATGMNKVYSQFMTPEKKAAFAGGSSPAALKDTVVTDPGFSSTSHSQQVAATFAGLNPAAGHNKSAERHMMHLDMPKGTNTTYLNYKPGGGGLAKFAGEHESVLPTDQSYRIMESEDEAAPDGGTYRNTYASLLKGVSGGHRRSKS